MKFSILRATLAKALQKAATVTGSRSTLPILGNVLLAAADNKLTVSATDLEVRIEVTVDAAVEDAGSTTLPARKLLQIVNLCPAETVAFDINELNHAAIDAGSASYTLFGLGAEDFPPPVSAPVLRELVLPQLALQQCISQVSYAVNEEENRRILKGILLSTRNGVFVTAGTDGKRLALVERPLENFTGAEGDAVIPLRSAETLKTILDKQGDVTFSASEKHAAFTFNFDTTSHCVMSCRLLEGNYPNYRQVIPKSLAVEIAVPSKPFQAALDRVALTTGGDQPLTRLSFTDGKLELESRSELFGNSKDYIALDYHGEPLVMQLNTRYINDPFHCTQADNMTFKMNDGGSPIVLESTEGFLSVIMPIRIRAPQAAPETEA